jgi:hypothetical protein
MRTAAVSNRQAQLALLSAGAEVALGFFMILNLITPARFVWTSSWLLGRLPRRVQQVLVRDGTVWAAAVLPAGLGCVWHAFPSPTWCRLCALASLLIGVPCIHRSILGAFFVWNSLKVRYWSPDVGLYHKQVRLLSPWLAWCPPYGAPLEATTSVCVSHCFAQIWAKLDAQTAGIRQRLPVVNLPINYVRRWFMQR